MLSLVLFVLMMIFYYVVIMSRGIVGHMDVGGNIRQGETG